MKEHPILFSAPMVCAILEGRKTQTRRVAKAPEDARHDRGGLAWYSPMQGQDTGIYPKYQPGDRLWVRETWTNDPEGGFAYRATVDPNWLDLYSKGLSWRPSIHMPRWASRITLEVESVRVERLQDISEADARAEGVNKGVFEYDCPARTCGKFWSEQTYRNGFNILWDDINAKRGFGWGVNPWVWVVGFKRVEETA